MASGGTRFDNSRKTPYFRKLSMELQVGIMPARPEPEKSGRVGSDGQQQRRMCTIFVKNVISVIVWDN